MTFSGRLMPYGLSVGKTGQNRLSFSQLVARGEATYRTVATWTIQREAIAL